MKRVIAAVSALLSLASVLASCGPSSTYYRDSAGLIRETKPEDPRLPYGVQQGSQRSQAMSRHRSMSERGRG